MASMFSRKGRRDGLARRRRPHKMDDGRAIAKLDGKGQGMTLTRKLLLSADLVGMEATVNFEQIYNVPILQTLGMPLSLAYLPGLVAGPSTLLFLPLLGWLADRGSNPQRRKVAFIVLSTVLQALGLMCVLLANMVHLQYLMDCNTTALHTGTGPHGYWNVTVLPASDGDDGLVPVAEFGANVNLAAVSNSSDLSGLADFGALNPAASGSAEVSASDSLNVPFKAGLGMLGFILMDLGFDCTNCFVRTFLVTCSPRAEHTSLIVVGVMMGAVGGVINSVLGLVDFTALLGMSSIEGAKLTIQTIVQGLSVIFIVIVCLLTTIITGRVQLRQLHRHDSQAVFTKFHENRTTTCSANVHDNRTTSETLASQPEHAQRRTSLVDAFENSVRSFGGSKVFVDYSVSLKEEKPLSSAEDAPLLENDTGVTEEENGGVDNGGEEEEEEEDEGDPTVSLSIGYGAVEKHESRTKEETSSVKPPTISEEHERGHSLPWLHNPKVRIFFVILTTFFVTDTMAMFTFTMSDFMGKGIYGGDPSAEPGSESLSRYQEGIQMASWVLFVYFTTYFVSSILHSKVLALLGLRLEFLLLTTLLVVTMMATALTRRLEVIFVLSVVAGMHRTCLYTMPYAVANDIAQSMVSTGTGRSPVGQVMSLVAATLPLSACLLFTWVGAAEELTGDISTPLWLGSAAGVLAIVAFLFVGKV